MLSDEKVVDALGKITLNLLHGNYNNEYLQTSLNDIHHELQKIESQSKSASIGDKNQLLLILQSFEVNLFRQFLIQIFTKMPSNLVRMFFDTIRLQWIIDIDTNPTMSDCYFKISLAWLTHDSIINYLTQTLSSTSYEINIDEQFLNLFCSTSSRAVYYKTSGSSSLCVSRKMTPNFFELTDTTDRLLRAFITYLNGYFLDDRHHTESDYLILKWLLTMADIYGFIPYFVKTGYPEAILEWMNKIHDDDNNEDKISLETWFLVINILYNFARHLVGIKALNKLKALKILKEWKNRYFSKSPLIGMKKIFEDILVAYYLLYALLLEPKEMKRENITSIENVLDHIIEQTLQAFKSAQFNCGLYNVSEYLAGLAKLVVNDKFLLYVISKDNMFDLFIRKFLEFNNLCSTNENVESTDLNSLICASLYTIFWSISFQADYSIKLKENEQFLQYVVQMSTMETTDEHTVVMKRASKGILFNLDLIQTDLQPIDEIENDDDNVKVMISYAHKDTKLCQALVNNLQDRVHGDLWVDFIKLKPPYEDDWEEIGRAITQCDVILMIVTENYCTSKSCRREVIHADKRNKRIIPIYHGKEYQPEDWFEIRVGSATFVRFGDNKNDEKVMETLLNLIHATDKSKRNLERKTSHETPTLNNEHETIQSIVPNPIFPVSPSPKVMLNTTRELLKTESTPYLPISDSVSTSMFASNNIKPIEEWTNVDIQEYLQLPTSSTIDLSCGQALLTYIRLLKNEDALIDEYETQIRHRGLSREQFANLIVSLTNLRCRYNVEETSALPPDQWTREEIKYWFNQHRFSHYLYESFAFSDGAEFLIYAQLVTQSPTRMDAEYDRLKSLIQNRFNPKDSFQLDEYARFVNALKKLLIRFQTSSNLSNTKKEEPAQCTIS